MDLVWRNELGGVKSISNQFFIAVNACDAHVYQLFRCVLICVILWTIVFHFERTIVKGKSDENWPDKFLSFYFADVCLYAWIKLNDWFHLEI